MKPTFACGLGALASEERAELPDVLARLFEASPVTRELDDGFEITFATSRNLFPLVAQWIDCESRCCPFFEFKIELAADGGPMKVALTGQPGVKEFILEELPALKKLIS